VADAVENIGLVARLGAALISANAPTTAVERAVAHLTERFGISASVTVLPNSVLAVETSKGITELGTARPGSYRFDQIDELFSLVEDLVAGEVSPHEATQRLDALERSQPLIGTGVRYLGFLLIILGLGLNQRPTVPDLLVAMVLGLIIAVVLVTMPKWGRLSIVAPIAVSFISTLGILIATNAGIVTEPTKVLIPLVASLIPGAPLAISSLELAQGAIVSGSSRLAVAVHQLVVLALGVALAMSLIHVRREVAAPGVYISWWFRPVGRAAVRRGRLAGLLGSSGSHALPHRGAAGRLGDPAGGSAGPECARRRDDRRLRRGADRRRGAQGVQRGALAADPESDLPDHRTGRARTREHRPRWSGHLVRCQPLDCGAQLPVRWRSA
jgi:uncharacterized membrane protein YjjP (DUF1212 family)